MKRLTTILCSIAFMISGFVIFYAKPEPQNKIYALSPPTQLTIVRNALPLDLQLDLAKHDSIIYRTDTIVQHDTVQIVKYKTKYRAQKKHVEPDSLQPPVTLDTLYVPELKISIQMSKDVLMDTTLILIPDSNKCPKIQPLRTCGE